MGQNIYTLKGISNLKVIYALQGTSALWVQFSLILRRNCALTRFFSGYPLQNRDEIIVFSWNLFPFVGVLIVNDDRLILAVLAFLLFLYASIPGGETNEIEAHL